MEEWVVWLIFAVILCVAEVFTLTAALGILGGAALVTVGAAAVGLPLAVQLLVFATTSVAGVVFVRPIALRQLNRPQLERFGVDALIGKSAHVVREVTGADGLVRIEGEEWTSRAYDEDLVIPVGATVTVMRIYGTTAVVYPQE
jgi:membrane protein implicated in regulation of membrane protease activity